MGNSVTLILVGGLISLASTLAGIALQHWLDLRKQKYDTRRYPTEVLFKKQTEFYDKTARILRKINAYVTTVDVYLHETAPDATRRAVKFAEETGPIWEFQELMEAYSMYLPEKILRAGNKLFAECVFISNSTTLERTERCINLLFSFQNTIRECVGADKISAELFKAFGTREREKAPKESEE